MNMSEVHNLPKTCGMWFWFNQAGNTNSKKYKELGVLIYKLHTKRRWRLQRQWLPDCFRPWHLAGCGWNLLPRFSQIQDEFSLWRGPRQIRIHLNKSQETAIIWKSVSSPPHRWPGTINTDQHCRSPTTVIACAAMRMAAGEGDALKFNSSSIASHQNPIFTSFHWTRILPMYSIDINFVHLPRSHLIEWTYSKSPTFEPILHLGHRVFDWKLGAPTVERVQHEPPGRYLASLAWLPKWPIPPLMLWPLLSAPSSQARLSPATQSRGGLFKCNNTLLEWFEFWKRLKMETTNSEIQFVVSLSQSSQQLHHKESR